MSHVLAVDFAPRHSAWAVMDLDTLQIAHFGALDLGPEADGFTAHTERLSAFVDMLTARTMGLQCAVVVEDVSHFMTKPAQVLRLQGAFRLLLQQAQFAEPTMVYPTVWQNWYGWHKTAGMTSKGFAKYVCDVLGYGNFGTTGKATVDVRDAVLIARWYAHKHKS